MSDSLFSELIERQIANLSEEQRAWSVPDQYYEAIENASLSIEELMEHRYERLIQNDSAIRTYLKEDTYFIDSFTREMDYVHIALYVIDNFHVGVAGFDHVFWQLAGIYLDFGVELSIVDHFFDPVTNKFEPYQDPLPPYVFHTLDTAGRISASNEKFERNDPNSAEWNFYRGLRSPSAEQRERFQTLFDRLEYGPDWDKFWDDDFDGYLDHELDMRSWTDEANEPILANLEEVLPNSGRPKKTDKDDRLAVMYAKRLLMGYYGPDPGKVPSRRSCIMKVAALLKIEDHNLSAFHKRIDRKLKRKMTMRNLGQ